MKKVALVAVIVLFFLGCQDFSGVKKTQVQTINNKPQAPNQGNVDESLLANPNAGEFSIRKMLYNVAHLVLEPMYLDLSKKSEELQQSLTKYCDVLSRGSDLSEVEKQAQADWRRAMLSYHAVATVPYGPLSENSRSAMDQVYSFPYLNACGIDQKVLSNQSEQVDVQKLAFNIRGLYAIEYLIFEPTLSTKCNAKAYPKLQEWNKRSLQVKKLDRCRLAKVLSQDITNLSHDLFQKWSGSRGHFAFKIISGEAFGGEGQALLALSDAVFQFEFLKDYKLGRPLGKHKECSEEKCPQLIEHPYSHFTLEAIGENLQVLRSVFVGSADIANKDGFGLDDLLINIGHSAIVTKVSNTLDRAIASVDRLKGQGKIHDQIEKMNVSKCRSSTTELRHVELCALHEDLRELSRTFKSEVLIALSLRAPPTQQGDND